MPDFYRNNLKFLTEKQTDIMNDLDFERNLDVVATVNNKLTIQVELDSKEKIFLHSQYRPKREAQRYINSYDFNNIETVILIGFGLGYYAEEILLQLSDEQKLSIVISSPDVFKIALKNKNLSNLLQDKRVDLVLSSKSKLLIKKMQNLLLKDNDDKLIYRRQFIKAIPNKFSFLRDVLEKINLDKMNNETQKDQIKENIIKNLKFAVKDIGINQFENLFINQPIFIVAAGPSLDKNIEQLSRVEDKGIIVAVDTAIDPLLNKNIRPNFIVTIESNVNCYNKIFKKHFSLDIPLVYTIGSHYQTVKNHAGPRIVGLSASDQSLNKLNEIIAKGRIETEGSVASTALDFAVKLGGDPIIFVGQDLAFANNKTHAEDTFYQSNELEEKHLKSIDGINNNKVFTNTAYYIYLKVIERYISEHSSIKFIDSTEGGARISGTRIKKLKTVIKKECQDRIYKKDKIKKIIDDYNPSTFNIAKIKKVMAKEL